MLSVRPKIAELVFQVYGRALHPELFEIYATRHIKRGPYEANVFITSAGHVVAWQYKGLILTEVAASAHHPLPERRRLMSHGLRGTRRDRIECRGGAVYEVNFSLERVDSTMFHTVQQQLSLSTAQHGMVHRFHASGRFGLGAMSYIHLDSRDRCLKIRALHTFPDDFAIVKSQSIFTLP